MLLMFLCIDTLGIFFFFILFYYIFPLYDIRFIDSDILHSYLYLLFHLVSIVGKKEMWIYVLEKNMPIRVELHTSVDRKSVV